MIRKDNEPIFESLFCGRLLSWIFFKHFLIRTFQQPHASGTDEETEAQRGTVVCYGHRELTAGRSDQRQAHPRSLLCTLSSTKAYLCDEGSLGHCNKRSQQQSPKRPGA